MNDREAPLSSAEFFTRGAAFLAFFLFLAFLLFFNNGLEPFGVLLCGVILLTLAKPGSDLVQEKDGDYILVAQVGMVAALLIVLAVVVRLGGVVDSAFVSFLTVPPVFFYLELRVRATNSKVEPYRRALTALTVLIYIVTIFMFDFDKIGMPFGNAVLEAFTLENANSIIRSPTYYKTQVCVFLFSILIFLWNLPLMKGIRLKVENSTTTEGESVEDRP